MKQVAALGAVAVPAMLAFVAVARAQVLAPQRNFDERIRTRLALEVEATTTVRLELTRLPAADVPQLGRRVRLRDVAALPTVQRDP